MPKTKYDYRTARLNPKLARAIETLKSYIESRRRDGAKDHQIRASLLALVNGLI